jgi:hypothetical protein
VAMSELLKPWLGPGLEDELRNGLIRWQSGGPTASGHDDEHTNFRVESKLKRVVQIIKVIVIAPLQILTNISQWVDFDGRYVTKNPLEALISDGSTYIQATFARSAVEEFERTQRRRLTDGTRGGLIKLLRYDIVVPYIVTKFAVMLNLFITEFKHRDCDGEGTIGNPKSILEKESIQTLIRKIHGFRKTMKKVQGINLQAHAVKNPNGPKGEEEDILDQGFATQIPRNSSHAGNPTTTLQMCEAGRSRGVKRPRNGTEDVRSLQFVLSDGLAEFAEKRQRLDKISNLVQSRSTERSVKGPSPTRKKQGKNTQAGLLELLSTRKDVPNLKEADSGRPRSSGNLIDNLSPPKAVANIVRKVDSHSATGPLPIAARPVLHRPPNLPSNTKQENDIQLRSNAVSPNDLRVSNALDDRGGHRVSSRMELKRSSGERAHASGELPISRVEHIGESLNDCVGGDIVSGNAMRVNENETDLKTVQSNDSDSSKPCEERIEYEGTSSARFARRGGASVLVSSRNIQGERKRIRETNATASRLASSNTGQEKINYEGTASTSMAQSNEISLSATAEKPTSEWEQAEEDPWQASSSNHVQISAETAVAAMDALSSKWVGLEDPWQKEEAKEHWFEKQESLIANRNTWLPSEEPSIRAPTSAVPTSILLSLTDMAKPPPKSLHPEEQVHNGRPEMLPGSVQKKSPPQDSTHEKSSEEEEDDESLASSDWPSSATSVKRANKLPPDSDTESLASLQVDKSKHTMPKQRCADAKERASESHVPLPSASVKSMTKDVTLVDGDVASVASGSPILVSSPITLPENAVRTTAERTSIINVHPEPIGATQKEKSSIRFLAGKSESETCREHEEVEESGRLSNQVAKASLDIRVGLDDENDYSSQSDLELAAPNALPEYAIHKYGKLAHQTPSGSSENQACILQVDRTPYTTGHDSSNGKPSSAELGGSSVIVPGTFNQDKEQNSKAPTSTVYSFDRRDSELSQDKGRTSLATELRGKIIELRPLHPPAVPEAPLAPLAPQVDDTNEVFGPVPKRRKRTKPTSLTLGEDGTFRENLSMLHKRTELAKPVLDGGLPRPEDPSYRLRLERRAFFEKCRAESRTSSPQAQVQGALFQAFREAYPDYKGNEKHFNAMCQQLRTMIGENRIIPKSMWDDFIIRHRKEYREYFLRSNEDGETPMPYEGFYCMEIDEPLYTKRIVTPANLPQGILIKAQSPQSELATARNIENSIISTTASTDTGNGKALDRGIPQLLPTVEVDEEPPKRLPISKRTTSNSPVHRCLTASSKLRRSTTGTTAATETNDGKAEDREFPQLSSNVALNQKPTKEPQISRQKSSDSLVHRHLTKSPMPRRSSTRTTTSRESKDGKEQGQESPQLLLSVAEDTRPPEESPISGRLTSSSLVHRRLTKSPKPRRSTTKLRNTLDNSFHSAREVRKPGVLEASASPVGTGNMDQRYSSSPQSPSTSSRDIELLREVKVPKRTSVPSAISGSAMETPKRRSLPWKQATPSSSVPSSSAARRKLESNVRNVSGSVRLVPPTQELKDLFKSFSCK